jgi:hypothetical protein
MTITVSVGATGRTYSTIQAAWNALPSTLADNYVLELYNDAVFSPLSTSGTGKTLGSFTVTIRPAAGHGFRDHANRLTNPLRPNQAYGVMIASLGSKGFFIDLDNVILDGLQVSTDPACVYYDGTVVSTAPGVLVKNCLLQSAIVASGEGVIRLIGGTATNCVFINTGDANGFLSAGGNAKAHNCTAVYLGSGASSYYGFRNNYDSPLYLNCASFGYLTPFRAGFDAASNYNASDKASPPGANSVASLTYANQFQNIASTSTMDFRVKAGSGLVAGTRDAANTADLDIVNSARSITTPTIGAWEYAAPVSILGGSATLSDMTASGAFAGPGTSDLGGSATLSDMTASGAFGSTLGVIGGLPPLKINAGTVRSSETGITVHIYLVAGPLVVTKTGVSTDGSGVLSSMTDGALVAGTAYRVLIVMSDGALGLYVATAT